MAALSNESVLYVETPSLINNETSRAIKEMDTRTNDEPSSISTGCSDITCSEESHITTLDEIPNILHTGDRKHMHGIDKWIVASHKIGEWNEKIVNAIGYCWCQADAVSFGRAC